MDALGLPVVPLVNWILQASCTVKSKAGSRPCVLLEFAELTKLSNEEKNFAWSHR
jgi:hypothetical protein